MNKSIAALLLLCAGLCFGEILRNDCIWEQIYRVSKSASHFDIYPVEAVTNAVLDHVPGAVWYTNHVVSVRRSGSTQTVVTNAVPGWYIPRVETNWWVEVKFTQTQASTKFPTWHRTVWIPADSSYTSSTNFIAVTNLIARSEYTSMDATYCKFVSWDSPFTPGSAVITRYEKSPAYITELPVRLGVPQSVRVSLPYEDILEFLPDGYPTTRIHAVAGFDGYIIIRFDERTNKLTVKRLFPEALPYEKAPDVILLDPDVVDRTI